MPSLELEFFVYCAKCDEGLCKLTTTDRGAVYVSPCLKCMERAKDEGYKEDHEDGYNEGAEYASERGGE